MRVDETLLKEAETSGMIPRRDAHGNIIAWKGPWLPHWYDNYMEALRENQNEHRIQEHKKIGLNEQGQTKEQEVQFKRDQQLAKDKQRKAELAAEMAFQNK